MTVAPTSIIDGVRTWLLTYSGLSALGVDFLDAEAGCLSIDSEPTTPILKQYLSGSLRQFIFTISSRENLDADVSQALNNQAFWVELCNWIEAQNKVRNYPVIGADMTVRRIAVTATPYPLYLDEHGTARYQIQCRLEYYKEGSR